MKWLIQRRACRGRDRVSSVRQQDDTARSDRSGGEGLRIKWRARILLALASLAAFAMTAATVFAGGTLSNPIWWITVDDAGYSDALYYSHDGFTHEMLSGEWAGAIQYDGIDTTGGEAMWLTSYMNCPSWTTNSTFTTVSPFSAYDDPANPVVGSDTGSAVTGNGAVEVAIQYEMIDADTAMGIGTGGVSSGQYVLLQTHVITNVSGDTLTNVDFFQFLHGHPNDSYFATNYGAYDDSAYGFADFQDFRYDITQWGDQFDENLPGSDIVGFSSNIEPTAYGVGEFPSDFCSGGMPSTGLHIDVENDTLPMNMSGGPLEIAGAMKWSLGDLAVGDSTEVRLLLSAGTNPTFPPEPPEIEVPVDIKPQSCPNPLNVGAKGVLPLAILGTADFDVSQVDPASVQLEGVSPLHSALGDVATPYEPYVGKEDAYDCTTGGPDGFVDITFNFNSQEVVAALGPVSDGDVLVLELTGNLKPEFGGTPIVGEDVVVVVMKK